MWHAIKLPFVGLFVAVTCIAPETDQQRLMNRITENYNKNLRPVVNDSDTTHVTLSPALFSVVQADEETESITILLWLKMMWKDDFIVWNSTEFGGLQQLFIPISDIWYPDIVAYNTIEIETRIPEEMNYAVIDENGSAYTYMAQLLKMECTFHINMFPFDVQNCTIDFASWMYSIDQIALSYQSPIDLSTFHPNSEWDLISMKARQASFYDPKYLDYWAMVHYDIVIQRKPTYYLLTFVIPCFMIMTISIIGVFSPFNDAGDREEKITMGLTTLLAQTVVLSLIAGKMPKSSEGLPLLGTYILLQISIAAVTSLISVIVMYQNCKWTLGEQVPEWIFTVTRLHRKKHNSRFKDMKNIGSIVKEILIDNVDGSSNSAFGNANNEEIAILEAIQSTFCQIIEYFYEKNEEETLRKEWQVVLHRLDLILMATFLLSNLCATIVFLIVGYSNLLK